jgi:hypothetical protein
MDIPFWGIFSSLGTAPGEGKPPPERLSRATRAGQEREAPLRRVVGITETCGRLGAKSVADLHRIGHTNRL